jgi:hypothetical protein
MDRTNRLGAIVDTRVNLATRAPRSTARGIAAILLMLAMATALTPASAKLPEPESWPTDEEWRLLPAYCPDTQGFKYGRDGSPNAPKWVAMMGPTFWALHHYCFGILKFSRSQMLGYPPVIRSGLRRSALGEFQFVIRTMPADYILAPEIYTYVGRTHLLMNEPDAANEAFARARSLKPDYWPAYSWLASYLANHGQKEQARALVASGLEHAPNSRTLQLIMGELTGKEPNGGK